MLDWAFFGKGKKETHHCEAKVQISWKRNEFFSEMWMKKSWGNQRSALKRTWREAELMANFSKVSALIRAESKGILKQNTNFSFLAFILLVSGWRFLMPWRCNCASASIKGKLLSFLKWWKSASRLTLHNSHAHLSDVLITRFFALWTQEESFRRIAQTYDSYNYLISFQANNKLFPRR